MLAPDAGWRGDVRRPAGVAVVVPPRETDVPGLDGAVVDLTRPDLSLAELTI